MESTESVLNKLISLSVEDGKKKTKLQEITQLPQITCVSPAVVITSKSFGTLRRSKSLTHPPTK